MFEGVSSLGFFELVVSYDMGFSLWLEFGQRLQSLVSYEVHEATITVRMVIKAQEKKWRFY